MITFKNTTELAEALKRAAEAHHIFEATNGKDENWPEWYAAHIARYRYQPTRVLITVDGGVAEEAIVPAGVEVYIADYDNLSGIGPQTALDETIAQFPAEFQSVIRENLK